MHLVSPCVIVMSERLPVPKLDVALRTLRPYWLYELFTTNCRRSRARTSELGFRRRWWLEAQGGERAC